MNLKKTGLRFQVVENRFENGAFKKRWRHDNHVISLTKFFSNMNPKWLVIVAFLNSFGKEWTKTFHAFSERNIRFQILPSETPSKASYRSFSLSLLRAPLGRQFCFHRDISLFIMSRVVKDKEGISQLINCCPAWLSAASVSQPLHTSCSH